jgi:hypothetical protein
MSGFSSSMRESDHSIRESLSTMRGFIHSIRESIKNYQEHWVRGSPEFKTILSV